MPNMGLLDTLWQRSADKHLVDLAEKIAQRSCAAVWARVHHRAVGMNSAEARGYIRAHAGNLLQADVHAAVSHRQSLGLSAAPRIAELATHKVVEALLREVVRVQKTTTHRRLA